MQDRSVRAPLAHALCLAALGALPGAAHALEGRQPHPTRPPITVDRAPTADAGPAVAVASPDALVDFDPDTLNLGSAGRWVTVTLRSDPEGLVEVTLDGRGSRDPEGAPLRYRWTLTDLRTGAVTRAWGAAPTVTLPVGEHEARLRVRDGLRWSEPDTTWVTVRPANLSQADASTLSCNGVPADRSELDRGELMVKFDRGAVAWTLDVGEAQPLWIAGDLRGEDRIRVIDP